MTQKEEIVSAIKFLMEISEKDFQNTYAPNGENDERVHFFAGKVSACREILKYIGEKDWNDNNKPTITECNALENPDYRKLWDYPLIAELFNKTLNN